MVDPGTGSLEEVLPQRVEMQTRQVHHSVVAEGHLQGIGRLALAAALLATGACKHRGSAPNASKDASGTSSQEAGGPLDWTSACALGKALGIPSTGKMHEDFATHEGPGPAPPYVCEGNLGLSEPAMDGVGTVGGLFQYSVGGYDKHTSCRFRLFLEVGRQQSHTFAHRVPAIADKLTRRVVGQAMPPALRHVLVAGGEKEVTLAGWTLKAKSEHASNGVMMDYSISRVPKPPHFSARTRTLGRRLPGGG